DGSRALRRALVDHDGSLFFRDETRIDGHASRRLSLEGEEPGNDLAGLFPMATFPLELLSACLPPAIELRAPIVVRETPIAGYRALLLQFQQDGIQGAVVDGEQVLADLLDALRDAVAVLRPGRLERPQDHERQGALPDFTFLTHPATSGRPTRACHSSW